MAEIAFTASRTQADTQHKFTWSAVTESDTCAKLTINELPQDISVHVSGTFGGATAVIKVANDGGTGVDALDLTGTAISLTAEGLKSVLERPATIVPTFSGGTSQSATVTIILWYEPRA